NSDALQHDADTCRISQYIHRLHYAPEIEQRLSLAHEHYVHPGVSRNGARGGNSQYLARDLAGSQVALHPHQSREAEPTVHSAAHLAGNAQSDTILLRHENGFHRIPVVDPKQITYRPILRGEFPLDRGIPDLAVRRQEFPETAVHVSKLAEVAPATFVNGVVKLSATVTRLPKLDRKLLKLASSHA